MLYILIEKDGEIFNKEWHVGELITGINICQVVEIQADGDELELIKKNFTNLPGSKGPIIRWYGDHAKFIAANLKQRWQTQDKWNERSF